MSDFQIFPCDVCGSTEAEEIPVARLYTGDQAVHVCKNCGFVYVRARRSAQAIADTWSYDLYQGNYTARIPAVKARQVYVADTIDTQLGLKDKTLCDIGGGEGQFLQIAASSDYRAKVFAIEPSPANCARLSELGIEHFQGTVEDFNASPDFKERTFEIVTTMWTLENCQQPRVLLDAAWKICADDGHIVVATGSRILVPFKKPLQTYLSKNPADSHSTRYSANCLKGILSECGFQPVWTNRYVDSDYLVVVAKKTDRSKAIKWQGDDWRAVVDFFRRWHEESQTHYADLAL